MAYFDYRVFVYYFKLPFKETVRRHYLRDKANEFGEEELVSWWNPTDYLGSEGEILLTEALSQRDILTLIRERL